MSVGDRHLSDEQLVERALASRTDAFAQLFERHRERVYRVAYRFVRNQADALDLCQEAFVKAFAALPTFKGQARFSTWLTRIVANTCVDFCRQASVRRTGQLDEETVTTDLRPAGHKAEHAPGDRLERAELREALDAAIAQLTPEHREVFLLHAAEGLTYEEIARAVGCPIGTVMSRLHYARKRLRGLLTWFTRE